MSREIVDSQRFPLVFGGCVHTAAADTEANKETFLRVLDEVVAASFVYHEPALGDIPSPEGLKQTTMGYRMAYPDLKFTSEEMIAEGDVEPWWAYDAMTLAQQITSPPDQSPVGVWVLSTPTPMGNNILMLHSNHAQDSTGTQFGGTLLFINQNQTSLGVFPDVGKSAGWVTQTARTDPDNFMTTTTGYGTRSSENAPDELLNLDVVTSTWKITGPTPKREKPHHQSHVELGRGIDHRGSSTRRQVRARARPSYFAES